MTNKEALKSLCNHCEKLSIRNGFIGCPFRNISNDYCEEFEIIEKELKALEILKRHSTRLDDEDWNNNIFNGIDYENLVEEERKVIKEWLENE